MRTCYVVCLIHINDLDVPKMELVRQLMGPLQNEKSMSLGIILKVSHPGAARTVALPAGID